MNLKSFWTVISRQIKGKLATFLISSGGIVIGVWAITLTSGLSFGLSNTLVTAINSQPAARTMSIEKESLEGDLQGSTLSEYENLKNKYPEIVDIVPDEYLSANIYDNSQMDVDVLIEKMKEKFPEQYEEYKDVIESEQVQNLDLSQFTDVRNSTYLTLNSKVFEQFYEENKSNWVGSKEKPAENEIVMCYSCSIYKLNEKFAVEEPEGYLGMEIELSFADSPTFEGGDRHNEDVDNDNGDQDDGENVRHNEFNTTYLNGFSDQNLNIRKYKVVAVVDDRDFNIFAEDNPIYLDFDNFVEARKEIDPTLDAEKIEFDWGHVFLDSYDDMKDMVKNLEDEGYIVTAEYLDIVKAIQTAFTVIAYILGGFGFIALIASVFGIVNVMTISVLERQKEIGILKSLGAKSRNIFWLFLIESSMFGVIGWLIGTLLAVGMGYLTAIITRNLIQSSSWGENLVELNISEFAPSFPFGLLITTLIISVVVTSVSGLIPSVRAARQNPVDVLRSE